jgi:hypothetical protein
MPRQAVHQALAVGIGIRPTAPPPVLARTPPVCQAQTRGCWPNFKHSWSWITSRLSSPGHGVAASTGDTTAGAGGLPDGDEHPADDGTAHTTRSFWLQSTSLTSAAPLGEQAVSRLVQRSLPPRLLGSPGHQGSEVAGAPLSTQADGSEVLWVTASQAAALQARMGSPGIAASCDR